MWEEIKINSAMTLVNPSSNFTQYRRTEPNTAGPTHGHSRSQGMQINVRLASRPDRWCVGRRCDLLNELSMNDDMVMIWCLCVRVCVMDSIFAEMKDTKIQEGRT